MILSCYIITRYIPLRPYNANLIFEKFFEFLLLELCIEIIAVLAVGYIADCTTTRLLIMIIKKEKNNDKKKIIKIMKNKLEIILESSRYTTYTSAVSFNH